jgi:hypothetical protein
LLPGLSRSGYGEFLAVHIGDDDAMVGAVRDQEAAALGRIDDDLAREIERRIGLVAEFGRVESDRSLIEGLVLAMFLDETLIPARAHYL